ncbi:hypothetical protein QFZ47_004134 [Variovorax paradoxus]|nr:hypothetical protein [Variovorax paradoxus]
MTLSFAGWNDEKAEALSFATLGGLFERPC